MGITVHYRGSLADVDRVEDFEDRVLDLALELGAMARVWRSASDRDPRRVMRGLIVELAPGQESTSLLVSPEGWLVGLAEIEHAEEGRLAEPPWCWVKTQFGPVEGHVTLVELLDAIKKEFTPDLEVMDEGGYWESRDVRELAGKFAFLQAAIDGLADGLRGHGLTPEAAEDPDILSKRIERIAQQVHRTIARPAEHPPVQLGDPDAPFDNNREPSEAESDAMFKENRRRQEQMSRDIDEQIQRGVDPDEAFQNAMRNLGIGIDPLADEDDDGVEVDDSWTTDDDDSPWTAAANDAAGRDADSLTSDATNAADATADDDAESTDDATDADDIFGRPDRHPLQRHAMDFMLRLHELLKEAEDRDTANQSLLFRGAGEMMGGLAQALSTHGEDDELGPGRGLAIVQLKRALRGAAYARGALYPLRASGIFDDSVFNELHDTLRSMETDIFAELSRLREELSEEQ